MDNFWNTQMITPAFKAMDEKQIEQYKKMGEHMFGSLNFEDSNLMNSICPPSHESVAYIEHGIRSGLLPRDLTEDEMIVLEKTYGENWYEQYGFKKDDIPEYGRSLEMKRSIEKAVYEKFEEKKR